MIFTEPKSELQVRLHIAEMLKDKIENDNYAELCEKAYKFVTNGIALPPQEIDQFAEVMKNLTSGLTQAIQANKQLDDIANSLPKPQTETDDEEEKLKELVNKNLCKTVYWKRIHCIVCGYSTDFDCLIVGTNDTSVVGDTISDTDTIITVCARYFYVPKDVGIRP